MPDLFSVTYRGTPPENYHGPGHWVTNSLGHYSSVIDRVAESEGTNPGDWASAFDAFARLRHKLYCEGWHDVRPITRQRL